jgi:hypothetical protein
MKKIAPSTWLVDMSYQRDPEPADIARYAARGLREELLGLPVLSERPDGPYVIDGNHRRLLLLTLGNDTPVTCLVCRGLSVADEAEMFYALQRERRGHTAMGQFRARVIMREPVALDIVNILKRHGKRVDSAKTTRSISAARALEGAYSRGALDGTIAVLCAWNRDDPSVFDGAVITITSTFLAAYGDAVDHATLVARLGAETPRTLAAHLKREKTDYGYSAKNASISVMRRIYNRRTKKTLQLPDHEALR